MISIITKKKFLNGVLYTFWFGVGSEIAWRILKVWHKRFSEKKKILPKFEVLFVNENSTDLQCDKINEKKFCKNKYCCVEHFEKITNIIRNAKYSIDIAMYLFNCHVIRDALSQANERGISIRIIGNISDDCASETILKLGAEGIPVRFYEHPTLIMHHKFCVIDARKFNRIPSTDSNLQPILLTGSANWTTKSLTINFENIIISRERSLIDEFQNQFDYIWDYLKHS